MELDVWKINKFYSVLCYTILCYIQNEDTVLTMPKFGLVSDSELSQSVRVCSVMCVCSLLFI
jgi:hypothetical protein